MMTRSVHLRLGALAALYLVWLACWLVFGDRFFGDARHNWDQATVAAVTGLGAGYSAWRTARPYRPFLLVQGLAFLLLAGSWLTAAEGHPTGEPVLADLTSDLLYAACVFVLMCAWGYLALERWHGRSVSSLTVLVFGLLMLGLATIYWNFYYGQYGQRLNSIYGRLDAVTAALEYAVLVVSLLCILLKERPAVVWMLIGTVVLMTGDMGYTIDESPPGLAAVWMLGQFMVLAGVAVLPGIPEQGSDEPAGAGEAVAAEEGRSGLSGVLILISLGAALLSPLIGFLPEHAAVWKSFLAVVFIVSLIVILVWITDRFDDTVSFLREFVGRAHRSRLRSEDWRGAPLRIRGALESTGLGTFLDDFRRSAAGLKEQVLFLGPEKLFGQPRDHSATRQATCFLVMPFGQEWSSEVHRILAAACEEAGVQAVRGDDLFTPTDILEDIWQSIHAADFVIADITGRNPNVLYELGIAHTLAKPVLILAKDPKDIPIDLATRRVLLYGASGEDWRADLMTKASRAAAAIVEEYGIETRRP